MNIEIGGTAGTTKDKDILSVLTGKSKSITGSIAGIGGTGSTDILKSMIPLFSVLLVFSFISLGISSLSNQVLKYVIIALLSILIGYSALKKEAFGLTEEDFIVFNASGQNFDVITNGKKKPSVLNNYEKVVIKKDESYIDNIPVNTAMLNDNCDMTYILTKITPGPTTNTIDLTLCSLDSPMYRYLMTLENVDSPIKIIGSIDPDSIPQKCNDRIPTIPTNPYTRPNVYDANDPYYTYPGSTGYLEELDNFNREMNKYTLVFYNFTDQNLTLGWFLVNRTLQGDGTVDTTYDRMGPNQSWPELNIPAKGMLRLPNEMYKSEDAGDDSTRKNYEMTWVDPKMRVPIINPGKTKGALITSRSTDTTGKITLTLKKIFPIMSFIVGSSSG